MLGYISFLNGINIYLSLWSVITLIILTSLNFNFKQVHPFAGNSFGTRMGQQQQRGRLSGSKRLGGGGSGGGSNTNNNRK